MQRTLVAALAAIALAAASAAPADAQSWLEKARQKAKEKAAETVDRKTEKTEKTEKVEKEPATPATAVEAPVAPAAGGASSDAARPGEGAWANYDFKPGDRILYADDFMKDEVGDFPKRMEFKAGALEIVDWKGTRYLRATSDSRFLLVLPEVLPERFTMEFDYMIPSGGEVWIFVGDDQNRRLEFGGLGSTDVYNAGATVHASSQPESGENATRIRRGRVLADGKYIKVYLDDRRTLNVPNGDIGRANKIQFYTDGDAAKPTLFGNFRVAAGGKKLYDALAESGRVATQGIYFDTGSDRIRPESTPTLKEIGAMLGEHADLKLTIEGHTDDVGAAAANQALSQQRAEAVKAYLVGSHGVDAARIIAKGLGSTKPAVPGTTPEARQQNRRVELVKM